MAAYFKLARPDGFDFHSGKTINYRAAIGGTVEAPDWVSSAYCGNGLHYSANPNDCFVGAKIPCSAYEVEPVGRSHRKIDSQKSKAKTLRVLREITDLNTLFGWNYEEAASPVHPFKITRSSEPNASELELLRQWASVGDSVLESVGDSVEESVGVSVWASVSDSLWASVSKSMVGVSVWASVWESVRAYMGSLFPGIEEWKYVEHDPGVYPFQPAVDLWRAGLAPSYDGSLWRLHAGPDGKAVWEGTI